MEKLLGQVLQINKMHAVSQVWEGIYDNYEDLMEIRNSSLYTLLLDFTNKPTSEMAHKLNNTWVHNYDYSDRCYFKANVDDNQWSLAIMSNDRYWSPCIVQYTSETGFQFNDDITALKEKLDIQTQKLTQIINNFVNGKEV